MFIKRILSGLILCLFVLLFHPFVQPVQSRPPEAMVKDLIQASETYFWLGVYENGNMRAFSRSRDYLKQAKQTLNASSSQLNVEQYQYFLRQIKGLEIDLDQQSDIHSDTLYGVFPLLRYLNYNIFADSQALGNYEIIDEPNVIAVSAAAESLFTHVFGRWAARPQLHVVFDSMEQNPAMENEILYLFSTSRKFVIHNRREVAACLTGGQLAEFDEGRITPLVRRALTKAFDINELLLIEVKEPPPVDKVTHTKVIGRVYQDGKDRPVNTFMGNGFCRDSRDRFRPILAAVILLFCLSLAAFTGYKSCNWNNIACLLASPVAAFLWGFILPFIIVSMLWRIAPAPDTLVDLSFWWPCLVGAGLFLVPAYLYKIAVARFLPSMGGFAIGGHCVIFFPIIGLGVCASLAIPLFVVQETHTWIFLALFVISGCSLLAVMGAINDNRLPGSFLLPGLLCLLLLGPAFFHLDLVWLAIFGVAASGVALAGGLSGLARRNRIPGETADPASSGRPESPVPLSVAELIQRTHLPVFQPFEAFERLAARVGDSWPGGTQVVLITGGAGTGKTASGANLVAGLGGQADRNPIVLKGMCPENEGESGPYAVFQTALGAHFKMELSHGRPSKLDDLDSALENIFDSLIPFGSLLFPPTDDAVVSAGNQLEIFQSIAATLEKLSKSRPVVLYLDDIHWIGRESAELLAFLLNEFPENGPADILFLMTARSSAPFIEQLRCAGMPANQLEAVVRRMEDGETALEYPDADQRRQILTNGLGLKPRAARDIAARVGEVTAEGGGLFWLLRMVGYLAENGYLIPTDQGFGWAEENPDELPIPDDFKAAIEDELDRFPEFQPVLECAACLGMEFSASILADSLEKSKLLILQTLGRIEKETGMLTDLRASDDHFAFSSSFLLEVLRKKTSAGIRGPLSNGAPQIVREYYGRVAKSMEKTLAASPGKIYEVAQAYYAAGKLHADRGYEYCLKAARFASRAFLYEKARRYVDWARECASAAHLGPVPAIHRLKIDCDQAHVEGRDQDKAARNMSSYLDTCVDPPVDVLILAARTFYDAGAARGDQACFAKAAETGREIVHRADSNHQAAEGHQFIGVSLPTNQPDRRKEHLEKAYALMKDTPADEIPGQALLSRIANSLAEQLSYGDAREKKRAEQLFHESIRIKERKAVFDRPGMARSYGGLGRLIYFQPDPDIDRAREFFVKDLEISVEIGDVNGQSIMHSLLGGCSVKQGDWEDALGHYQASFDLAKGSVNRYFAIAGILDCLVRLDRKNSIREWADELRGMAACAPVPKPPLKALTAVVQTCINAVEDDALEEILELLNHVVDKG